MDYSKSIEMPAILDCLRKDIYSLVSKLQLPQEQQIQIGQLIEQIRLEENKYEQDIHRAFDTNKGVYESKLTSLNEKCCQLENQLQERAFKDIRRNAERELESRCIISNYL